MEIQSLKKNVGVSVSKIKHKRFFDRNLAKRCLYLIVLYIFGTTYVSYIEQTVVTVVKSAVSTTIYDYYSELVILMHHMQYK